MHILFQIIIMTILSKEHVWGNATNLILESDLDFKFTSNRSIPSFITSRMLSCNTLELQLQWVISVQFLIIYQLNRKAFVNELSPASNNSCLVRQILYFGVPKIIPITELNQRQHFRNTTNTERDLDVESRGKSSCWIR